MKWKIIEPTKCMILIETDDVLLKAFGDQSKYRLAIYHPANTKHPIILEHIPETTNSETTSESE